MRSKRCCPSRFTDECRSFSCRIQQTSAHNSPRGRTTFRVLPTLNAAHASQTQPNFGRSFFLPSESRLPWTLLRWRLPGAVCGISAALPLFIRPRLVRSRSMPLPTRSRRRLASAPATQIPPRTNGGLLAPPPPHRSIYIWGARRVPEL